MSTFCSRFTLAAPLVLGCSGPVALDSCPLGQSGQTECVEQITQQGRSFQGRSFQGRSFQGTGNAVLNVEEIRIGGIPVLNLRLEGTRLVGSLADQEISGEDFIGATVLQKDPGGLVFESSITEVRIDPQDPAAEILLYTLTAYNSSTGTSENVCSPDPFGDRSATPVYGTWDSSGAHINIQSQFMFACTSGVVAKCVRWGYKPWKSLSGRSLADYHQTCTRMARADYCGDGISQTEDGTLIDLYDDLEIQKKSPLELSSLVLFDGAWSSRGAYCIGKDRWINLLQTLTLTLGCKLKFLNLSLLPVTSPVDPADLCLMKRGDVQPSEVHIDSRSGINLRLL